jgi:spore germination cell wall hydrolase CwlJ-like protein
MAKAVGGRVLQRLKSYLANDHHGLHLAGAQLALVLALTAGLAIASVPAHRAPKLMTVRLTPAAAPQAAAQPVDTAEDVPVIRLQDMTPDQARKWNASNPIAKGANPAARPFHLETEGVLDEARAVDCMTAAIYYEAGFESTDGQRAVAQVVLNRMRHPAFPKSVCGVVFQGADHKGGGCQFTFTCDGALAREPQPEAWARARKVAEAALNGYVMKKVGMATHYHAEYVAPYWSPTLVKLAVIGQHIFYRWTGSSGTPPAFGGHYAGGEMAGLKVATLDNLGKGGTRSAILSASNTATAAPSVAAPVADAPAPAKIAVASKPLDLVTAQAEARAVGEIVKPEDLDWAGRPKAKAPSRIATPAGGLGGRAY